VNPRERKAVLTDMIKSPGWRLFAEAVQEQNDAAVAGAIMRPLKSLDESLEQEFVKGTITGRVATVALPETMIEQLEAEIQLMEKSNVQETE
jgi:hypothetical protein